MRSLPPEYAERLVTMHLPLSRSCGRRRGDEHPVHRQRRERGHPARLAVPRHEHVHMKMGDRVGDQRKQRHASDVVHLIHRSAPALMTGAPVERL